jgi:two-component system chemotaxis response regulator CheB
MLSKKIKVLIIDDSALIRMLLTNALSKSDDIEVVGSAADPLEAREMIKKTNPDVLTLDIEMPKMDGITFLKNLMRLRPMPVVMISTLTKKGANVTLKALEYGAVDFVAKPDTDIKDNLMAYSGMLIEKVKAAAASNVESFPHPIVKSKTAPHSGSDSGSTSPQRVSDNKKLSGRYELIAIGASTGGTEAIKNVLSGLPTGLPPIVMTQHIPPVFSTSFAKRLDENTKIHVHEPTGRMQLEAGHAYLAPGDKHMRVVRQGGKLFVELDDSEPVNRHKPSVEVLFNSVAQAVKKHCVGIMLTGMGADGADSLKALKDLGAHTIAQDKASSVVWGMPGAVVQRGGAVEVLDLNRIAGRITSMVYTKD